MANTKNRMKGQIVFLSFLLLETKSEVKESKVDPRKEDSASWERNPQVMKIVRKFMKEIRKL